MARCIGENYEGNRCGAKALRKSKYCKAHQAQGQQKDKRTPRRGRSWILRILTAPLITVIALHAGLFQDLINPVYSWLCTIEPIYSRFCTIEEVESLPHLSFEYQSNYPAKYLRLTQGVDHSKGLESTLYINNESKYALKNFSATIYSLRGDVGIEKFLIIYNLNDLEYIKIGKYPYSIVKKDETIPINIIHALSQLFENNEKLTQVILPELNKPQNLWKVLRNSNANYDTDNLFTKEEYLLDITFIPWPLSKKSRITGEELPYGFNGAILKIVIEYEVGENRFKHLLAGGMYYTYVIDDNKEIPIGEVTNGFMKTDYSLWAKKNGESFSLINISQNIVDLNEEGNFGSSVGGPVKPGQEVTLRLPPGAIEFKNVKTLPVPYYVRVENNVGKPQQ